MGKLCPVKVGLNAINELATKRLSQTIKECYELFDLVDNFAGLVEWEDRLKISKCESIGQENAFTVRILNNLIIILLLDY